MAQPPDGCGDALLARWPDGYTAIVLSPRLSRRERNSALAHELVHDERGGGCDAADAPCTWRALVAREEAVVDREVARRLVPLDELTGYCDRLADDGQGIEPWMVADEFDVTDQVARLALQLLTEHERGTR